MKDLYAGGISITALIGAASLLLTVTPAPSLAQRGTPGATAAGRRMDTLNRQGEQYERDSLNRDGKRKADSPGERRRAEELAGQVRRDFEGLQAGYNKLVLAMSHGGRLDLDSVIDTAAEVRKCAARLRDNLALPRAKVDERGKAPGEDGGAQIEESLLLLRKHIYSFVTNPLFESRPVLDVEHAGKAGRDLEMILELSEAIRKRGAGQPTGRQD